MDTSQHAQPFLRRDFCRALVAAVGMLLAVALPRTLAAQADPLGVLQRLIAAENAGDLDAVMALWADDAVLVNTRGRRVSGLEAIRNFERGNIKDGIQHTLASPTVAHDTVSWAFTDETDFYRRLGVSPVHIVARAQVRDSKVIAFTGYFPVAEIDRIEAACRAPQNADVRLFGQSCDEFITAARAHTKEVLGQS